MSLTTVDFCEQILTEGNCDGCKIKNCSFLLERKEAELRLLKSTIKVRIDELFVAVEESTMTPLAKRMIIEILKEKKESYGEE